MRLLSLLTTCLVAISTQAQISIIPQPASVKQPKTAAKFSITPSTQIVLEGSNLENIAGYLNDYFQQFYHFKLKVAKTFSGSNAFVSKSKLGWLIVNHSIIASASGCRRNSPPSSPIVVSRVMHLLCMISFILSKER